MTNREIMVDELVIDLKDAQEIVSQIDEPQKVVVPKFVAEWVEEDL